MPDVPAVLERESEAETRAPSRRREAAQINVRIDPALKAEGDNCLAEAGYSPSQAIRQLWYLASRYRGNPGAIKRLLTPADDGDEVKMDKGAAARRGYAIVDDARGRAGIPPDAVKAAESPDDSELYAEALVERYESRGLL